MRGLAVLLLALVWAAAVPLYAAAQDNRSGGFWTPWVSEETPPAICRRGYAVTRVKCRGRYCDDKQLWCERYSSSRERTRYSWSKRFSEEGAAAAREERQLVTGIACNGRYCDNLSLQFMRSGATRRLRNCDWNDAFFSEERPGEGACNRGAFVAGIRCRGAYCDKIDLYCCDIR